jgi:hypothetical protein
VKRAVERVLLGALMTVAVVIAERRLRRSLRREGDGGRASG